MDIKINDRSIDSMTIVNELFFLPIDELVRTLSELKIKIRKRDIVELLKLQLDKHLDAVIESNKISIEYKRRLKFYEDFTLYQLIQLANVSEDFDLARFKIDLLEYIIIEKDKYNLLDYSIIQLVRCSMSYRTLELEEPSIDEFFDKLSFILTDPFSELSGVKIKRINLESITLEEIKNIARYSGVVIPRRLKKNELKDLMLFAMERRNIAINNELEIMLEATTTVGLEKLSEQYNLPCKIELKKDGILEYILYCKSIRTNKKLSNNTESVMDLITYSNTNVEDTSDIYKDLLIQEIAKKIKAMDIDLSSNEFKVDLVISPRTNNGIINDNIEGIYDVSIVDKINTFAN